MRLLGDMATYGPELQLRTMSESMALLHPGSVLMAKASATVKSLSDTQDQEPS